MSSEAGRRRDGELGGVREEGDWSLVIEAKRKWLEISIRELLRYRDLIWLFVKRDFVAVYKQTILGPLWFVLNPLFTTIIYNFIFGRLAKIPTDGVPQSLFYFGGTMLWSYFAISLTSASDTFTTNAALFGKIYFPRLTVPISKAISNLIPLLIQSGALACLYAFFALGGSTVRPTWWALMVPLIFVQLALLGTGFGMIVSSLTTKYRDLRQLVNFGVSLWLYATPIVYPLSRVPENLRWIMVANPVSVPIEGFRIAVYGVGGLEPPMIWVSVLVTAVVTFTGLILFSRMEKTFVDVI